MDSDSRIGFLSTASKNVLLQWPFACHNWSFAEHRDDKRLFKSIYCYLIKDFSVYLRSVYAQPSTAAKATFNFIVQEMEFVRIWSTEF